MNNPLVKSNLSIRVGDPTSEFMIRPSVELAKIKVGEILPFTMTAGQDPAKFKWLCDDSEIARTTNLPAQSISLSDAFFLIALL